MDEPIYLERPELLQEGQSYYLVQAGRDGLPAELVTVTFLAYTSCPAAVIVRAADNSRLRCSRLELYAVSPVRPC